MLSFVIVNYTISTISSVSQNILLFSPILWHICHGVLTLFSGEEKEEDRRGTTACLDLQSQLLTHVAFCNNAKQHVPNRDMGI